MYGDSMLQEQRLWLSLEPTTNNFTKAQREGLEY
jgi:hypothetical protein